MPSRATFYTEALTTVIASGATRVTVATLTFTNVPSAQYVVGGSWNIRRNLTDRSFSQLLYMETAATATVVNYGWGSTIPAPLNNRSHFGFRRITTPASAGTQTVRLQCHVSSEQSWEEITNARIFAIKTTANDGYGEKTTDTEIQGGPLGVGEWKTICSATFSAAAAPYIIWGCSHMNNTTLKQAGLAIYHQGTARGFAGYQQKNAIAIGTPLPHSIGDTITPAAGSNVFELRAGCSGVSVTAQDPRMIVWRAADFNAVTAIVSNVTVHTSSATFVTGVGSAVPMASGPRYAIFSHVYDRSEGITDSHMAEFLVDTVTASEQVYQTENTAVATYAWYPQTALQVVSASAGTHELRFLVRAETAGTNVDLAMQRIFVMQVEATAVAGGGGFVFNPVWLYHQISGLH